MEGIRDTVRIPESRLMPITTAEEIQEKLDKYDSNVMSSPKLYVEIIILPNITNDNPTPKEYAE